jgi:hypothetical protein
MRPYLSIQHGDDAHVVDAVLQWNADNYRHQVHELKHSNRLKGDENHCEQRKVHNVEHDKALNKR